eukprot:gnl/Hemi2/18768_TR6209_c0_g1_i1.p1 gnl/Hemi2/18768_TR6209_c0_g1~~gnl/Hemi2/18768_TR6209_c0_g1_i1.p1  ORF type:complete len:530 (-),score=98.10 gnl/Hemi2/18768_TR6209_c0_g1_i1:123-1712(-)
MRRALLAALAGGGASLSLLSSPLHSLDDPSGNSRKYLPPGKRLSLEERLEVAKRTAVVLRCLAVSVYDYKMTLSGIPPESPRHDELAKQAHLRTAKRLLRLALELGGVFVKAGQHVESLRPAIPAEFTDTLSALQDRASPSSMEDVRRVLKEEFGAEIPQIFSTFDEQPVGSASLAQVHRATLLDGTQVAVKVQHARLRATAAADMAALERVTRIVAWCFKDYQFEWILPEFRTNLFLELDFEHEAQNAERTAHNFRHTDSVYIPKVFWPHTKRRVLTMEFVHGCKVTDRGCLARNGFDKHEVARAVVDLFGDMVYSHGFIHCDPHPGNIFVRQNPQHPSRPQIVLLDHGLYREIDPTFRLNYCRLWRSMILRDEKAVLESATALGLSKYAAFLPLIFTHRSLDSKVALGGKLSDADKLKLNAPTTVVKVNHFLETLPRDLLFILRTSNLVRGLNLALDGSSADRFFGYALSAVRGSHVPVATTSSPVAGSLGFESFRHRVRTLCALLALQWDLAAFRFRFWLAEWFLK